MKRLLTLFTVLVFAGALLSFPMPLQAAVGVFIDDATTGVDANGTSYINGWVAGGDFSTVTKTFNPGDVWYESYSVDSQSWYAWYEIDAFTDPLNFTTGDSYNVYTNLSDGAGGTAMSNIAYADGVSITERQMANSVTGFLDYYYEYDDSSGTVGAYYEEIVNYVDPSGTYSYDYNKKIDIDDGNYYDDWTYDSWNYFEAGTGDGRQGSQFYNYVEGIQEYNDYDWNSLTGYFDIDQDSYLDTDLNGNWYDNYYTNFDEYFDVYSGEYVKQTRVYDYDGMNTGGNAAYTNQYDYENRYSGEFEHSMDARLDTDGDGNWNDYSSFGDFGAYRTYDENSYWVSSYPYTYTETALYDSINHQMSRSYSEVYTNGDYAYSDSYFRWDADGDGSYSDDYYWDVYNESYSGEMENGTTLYDYVSANANYYRSYHWEDVNTGDFYTTEQTKIDNDGDGDFNDWASQKGAYYSYSQSSYDSEEAYSYASTELWDPAGDYDAVTGVFGTYQYTRSWSYAGGDSYSESEYAKDTDKDGDIETGGSNDLWQYAEQEYDADELYTYAYSEVEEDTANARGAYSRAWTESELYAGSGEYYNDARVENLGGMVRTSEGYEADDGYRWSENETATWGASRTYFENWSYDGGDFGVDSRISVDTDANTAYNNQNDYEAYAYSWDETYSWGSTGDGLAGGRYVGSSTDDYNTNDHFRQEFAYTSSGDSWEYYSYDGATGNQIDQMLYYASGDLAAGAAPAYGTVYYEGAWASPYTWVEYMYVGAANAWYLVDYNLL
jgi:hypothetical protein